MIQAQKKRKIPNVRRKKKVSSLEEITTRKLQNNYFKKT